MGKGAYTGPLERIDDFRWRIPKTYRPEMRVDGVIYANDALMEKIRADQSPEQVANVACLPGIVGASIAMPDIHWGYGFSIGGVAATDPDDGGVISPGGVGYDINCGVRLIRSNIPLKRAEKRLPKIVDRLFEKVPCGVGERSPVKFSAKELSELMVRGVEYVIERGMGWRGDAEVTEANGRLAGALPECVSDHAIQRGMNQCGSLGAGNHFLEVQVVEEIYDDAAATAMGLELGKLAFMIHSGSRGLGYQVCDDALRDLRDAPAKYGIELPDRQLACAPINSPEGQKYLGAMRCAANFAWANRQIMTHLAREAISDVMNAPAEELGLHLVYDVAHNIAKMERYTIDGRERTLCVHRKGATRAFPPGHPETPERYRAIGQPVLVPGDMGRYSYVLVGQPQAMEETFGSACHGAGRLMSRTAANKMAHGRSIAKELQSRGVYARARSKAGLNEEQPAAYKDVADVVSVLQAARISKSVARLKPVGVVKG